MIFVTYIFIHTNSVLELNKGKHYAVVTDAETDGQWHDNNHIFIKKRYLKKN